MDEILNQFQQRYQQLRAMRDAGRLSPQQFMAELQKLRWQDGSRVWWTINPEGVFLRYDGRQWIPVQPAQITPNPPQVPAQAPAAPPLPVQVPAQPWPAASPLPVQAPPKPRTAKSGCSSLLAASPILAIVPSLLCGTLWFLYTLLGVFKSEGIGGIDCITPLIVGGLPVLFWVLRKPLDKLLLPLKPIIRAVPKPLRLGIALAVPIALGCGCSMLSPSGYWGLNLSSFISVMLAAVLLRF